MNEIYGIHCKALLSHASTVTSGPGTAHCRGFTVTLRHTTLGGTPVWTIVQSVADTSI
jgi:hypothetical protein